jgi:hypothetical protein
MNLLQIEQAQRRLAAERAARGAQFLDQHLPGWTEFLDLDYFNLASPSSCVIGQLADKDMAQFKEDVDEHLGYCDAIELLATLAGISPDEFEYLHGFNRDSSATEGLDDDDEIEVLNYGFDQLQEAWIPLIQARQGAPCPHCGELVCPEAE